LRPPSNQVFLFDNQQISAKTEEGGWFEVEFSEKRVHISSGFGRKQT
jgi:hypothetical protein